MVAGGNRGQVGKVTDVKRNESKLVVEGVNLVNEKACYNNNFFFI